MTRINPAPTTAQRAALVASAERHGQDWKAELRARWMDASAGPELHRLRNTHGPAWLATVQI